MGHFNKIGIIGAGHYGLAIAQCFSTRMKEIVLISDSGSPELSVSQLYKNMTSSDSEPSTNINCTNDFLWVANCDVIFIAVPALSIGDVCKKILEYKIEVPIVLCSKGFDIENGRLLSDMLEEALPNEIAIFSGPSFASEIAKGLPAGVNIAGRNASLARKLAEALSSPSFTIKAIDDFVSLQVAGAMKNILSIGCGVVSGLDLGSSAVAKLMVYGLYEMIALASELGGQKDTFFELGGIGDIILTCTSKQSRNGLLGVHLATGGNLDNWHGNLAEGAFSVKAVPLFAKKYHLGLKIFSEIYEILYGHREISRNIFGL
jgi:glycerol-3-phosphate dehydrogenase (NAD(P)+)